MVGNRTTIHIMSAILRPRDTRYRMNKSFAKNDWTGGDSYNFREMMELIKSSIPIRIFGNSVQDNPFSAPQNNGNFGFVYYREGERDGGDPWVMICEFEDGRYALVTASTDYYTGFEIGGQAFVYVATNLATLITGAMSAVQYVDYIAETMPVQPIKEMNAPPVLPCPEFSRDFIQEELPSTDSLGTRMKYYEQKYATIIPPYEAFIVRLDGRSFSKFTKPMHKPFDRNFVEAMCRTMENMLTEFGCRTTYCHSDEITLIFDKVCTRAEYDDKDNTLTHMFGGKCQKILSHTAAYCSVRFNFHLALLINKACEEEQLYSETFVDLANERKQTFEARIVTFEGSEYEIANHQIWRSVYDCHRNAVSTFVDCHYPSELTERKNSAQKIEMLATKGIVWAEVSIQLKYGTYCKQELYDRVLTNGDTCEKTRVVGKSFKISCSEESLAMLLAKYWNSPHGYDMSEMVPRVKY